MNASSFWEDRLPEGQKPIETRNVSRTCMFLRLLTDEERPSPTMGVIFGDAGVGKTIATQLFLDRLTPSSYVGLPLAMKVTVNPRSSPRDLAATILESLREKPPKARSTSFEIANDAAQAVERSALRLLLFDEADRLNADSFDVLRHLFDKTGCPIALVGLPTIFTVINHYDKFRSRVGLRLPFDPLNEQETLTVVLPQITLARWVYHLDDPEDQQMGKDLWNKVGSSLRDLVSILNTASQIATTYQSEKITPRILQEAYGWAGIPPEPPRTQKRRSSAPPKETPGEHERVSETRQEGKQMRRRRKQKPPDPPAAPPEKQA